MSQKQFVSTMIFTQDLLHFIIIWNGEMLNEIDCSDRYAHTMNIEHWMGKQIR